MQASLVLFPTFGTLDQAETTWTIKIHGALYQPRQIRLRKKILIRLLRRGLGGESVEWDAEILDDRLHDFVAATRRGQRVVVRAGSHQLNLLTHRNGHFAGQLRLPAADVQAWPQRPCLELNAESAAGVRAQGQAQLVSRSGLSVISDIDDTIKHTLVARRRELLRNTFLREFQSVSGMAQLYRTWAEHGAAFHYVSASPWQIYRPLFALFERDAFPAGAFHLRTLHFRRAMLKRLLRRSKHGKIAHIRSIIDTFPDRRFILVGDSGQQDPETYAQIAREFPGRIDRIVIREVAPLAGTQRMRQLTQVAPPAIWQVFRDASELHDLVPA